MRLSVFFLFLLFATCAFAQDKNEQTIRSLLATQTEQWNKGNIEGFMQTYWNSDSLVFIGKSGVNHGWQKTLANYKRSYPDTTAMGKLSFDILEARPLSPDYYYVIGKWMLHRTIGDLNGHFDLLIKKINGHWLIIADHSS